MSDVQREAELARVRITQPRTSFKAGQLPFAAVSAAATFGGSVFMFQSLWVRIGLPVVVFIGLLIDRSGGEAPDNASVITHALNQAGDATLWFTTKADGLVFFCPDGVFVESQQDFFSYASEWGPRSGSWPRLRSVSYDEARHRLVLQNDPPTRDDDPDRSRVELSLPSQITPAQALALVVKSAELTTRSS